jgi:hypothetical protein
VTAGAASVIALAHFASFAMTIPMPAPRAVAMMSASGVFHQLDHHVRRRRRSPLQMLRDENAGGVVSRSHSLIRPVSS